MAVKPKMKMKDPYGGDGTGASFMTKTKVTKGAKVVKKPVVKPKKK